MLHDITGPDVYIGLLCDAARDAGERLLAMAAARGMSCVFAAPRSPKSHAQKAKKLDCGAIILLGGDEAKTGVVRQMCLWSEDPCEGVTVGLPAAGQVMGSKQCAVCRSGGGMPCGNLERVPRRWR